jgi:hypothetical protein
MMNHDDDFSDDLDSYRSWEAFIAYCRAQWLAGEPLSPGPWHKPPREDGELTQGGQTDG